MQVSVSRRARILVAADGSWRSSAGGTRAVILALRDAQGKTLGEVETFGGLAAGSANDSLPISVAGVLDDKSGLPVVLEPGTYTLDMVLATYAGSCGSEVEFLAPHLTYVLLGAGA